MQRWAAGMLRRLSGGAETPQKLGPLRRCYLHSHASAKSLVVLIILSSQYLGTPVQLARAGSPTEAVVPVNADANASQKAREFLQISGSSLLYKGEKIRLQGVNQNNLVALCARKGKFNYGSCNIDDINISEADYARMSDLGMNHIRFGLAHRWYNDDREKFFRVLDANVSLARKYGLWIVWTLFTTPEDCYEGYAQTCSIWNDRAEQAALRRFWVDVAKHYESEPAVAGYGILNEPTPPAMRSTSWRDLAQEIRNAITEVNPRAIVVISSTSSASFSVPFEGDNILYEVHDYVPLSLTHGSDEKLNYPGDAPDYDGTTIHWSEAAFAGNGNSRANLGERLSINWAKRNNVPLYISEWGTGHTYRGYLQFLRDKSSLYASLYDVGHALHVWRGAEDSFGLFPFKGALVPFSEEYLEAASASWKGARRPTF